MQGATPRCQPKQAFQGLCLPVLVGLCDEQSSQLQTQKKLKPPQKQDVAHWISDGMKQLQQRPDMIEKSFEACGITSHRRDLVRPDELIEGQCYPDSDDEHDPFNYEESLLDTTDL